MNMLNTIELIQMVMIFMLGFCMLWALDVFMDIGKKFKSFNELERGI